MRCLAAASVVVGTCIAATGVMAEPDLRSSPQVLTSSMGASEAVRREIDRLSLLQDAAARGEVGAAFRQKALLSKIGEIITATPEAEYRELVGDAIIYVLSGGNPDVAERIARSEGLSARDRGLLRAAILFMRGNRKEAGELLAGIEPVGLSARLAGRVALAQALASTEPARQDLFAVAASAMPGTLVEESALRRSALHFAEARDENGFWRRLDRYVRRFPSSSYAPVFWGNVMTILADWSKKVPQMSLGRLDTILTMLPQQHRRKIYLELARRSAAAGEPKLTGLAGRRLRRLAVAGSLEDQLGLFYTILYQIVSADGDSALLKLKTIQPKTLGPQERALLKASLAIGQQIEKPPSMSSSGKDDVTEKTAVEIRGAQLLSRSYELISELK